MAWLVKLSLQIFIYNILVRKKVTQDIQLGSIQYHPGAKKVLSKDKARMHSKINEKVLMFYCLYRMPVKGWT